MQAAAQSMSRKTTSAGLGVLALIFVALGVYTTAEGLIELGPMQQSLCSEIPSVKRIAHVEVFLFRILCFSSGALIVATGAVFATTSIVTLGLLASVP